MHWLLLALIAIIAGFLYPKVTGFASGLPGVSSVQGTTVGSALVTGAFILVTIMVSVFLVKLVFPRKARLPGM